MTAILLLVLKLSVVALIFSIGLGSAPTDFVYLWRRPVRPRLGRRLHPLLEVTPALGRG